jgi:RecA/RadA recombinase
MEDSKDSYKNLEIYLQNVKIKQKINNNYKKNPSEKNSTTLSTSSFNIDNILDSNGLKAGEITLFYGKFRTGKTQMGFNACCEIYKHFSQEKSKKLTLFIDTEGTFRPERISEIALFKRISPDDLLKSIYVVKVQAISELKLVFGKIEEIIEQEKIQLIIIDSLTSLFRVELGKDDKESYQVIGELVKTLDQLSKLLKAKHIPALCTSQVSGNVGDIRFFDVSPILPAILNIYIKQWILLSEDENEYSISDQTGRRCAHLINSQEKKEEIVKFRIVSGGIEDIF